MVSSNTLHAASLQEETRDTGALLPYPQAALALAGQFGTQPRYVLSVTHRMTGWWWSITQQDPFALRTDVLPQDTLLEYIQAYVGIERQPTQSNLRELLLWLEEIPAEYFDQVHLAYGAYATHTQDLPKLLRSLARTCRWGGSFHWTEGTFPKTTSPAFEQLIILTAQTLRARELGFPYGSTPETRERSMLSYMGQALREIGCPSVQCIPRTINVSAFTALHPLFVQQMDPVAALLWSHSLLARQQESEETIEILYRQRQGEIALSTFEGTCSLHTFYGTKTPPTIDIFSSVLAIVSDMA